MTPRQERMMATQAHLDQSLDAMRLIQKRLGGHAAALNGLDSAIFHTKNMESPVMKTADVIELLERIRLAGELKTAP